MTEHDRAAAPDAAEIAAITHILNGWGKLLVQAEMNTVDLKTVQDAAVLALNTINKPVRTLLAAVEAQSAENARLKNDLEIALDMILQGDANHDDLMWADMTHTERFGVFNRPSEGE